MQIHGLHKNIYKLSKYALSLEKSDNHPTQFEKGVKMWEKAKAQGCDTTFCAEYSGVSRASYYRHRKKLKLLSKGILSPSKKPKNINKPRCGESHKQLTLGIRRENPTYGKAKIAVILKRDHGQTISESTVGHILLHLKERGLIQKSLSALRPKRPRNFHGRYAKPWEFKEYKTMKLGERVQIDHMTVRKNGITFKHFQAWDRRSKFIFASLYSHAKASAAKRFLMEFVRKIPFEIKSIQVDGGS